MRETIAVLQKLSLLDERILEALNLVKSREADLERQRGEESVLRDALRAEKTALEDARGRHRDADREATTCRDRKAHFEKQLREVKTDIEYQTLLREIATMERKASEWEDQILELMEFEEASEAKVGEMGKTLSATGKLTADLESLAKKTAAKAQETIAALEVEREKLLGGMQAKILGKYERLRKVRGDLAIVPVIEGSCGGCHYGLPPQVANEVRQGLEIRFCEGCGRFLVAAQET